MNMRPSSATGNLRVEHQPTRLAIFRSGMDAPILVQQAQPDTRAFIHPILAPDGHGTLTENAPAHHPWQHGLYVGLNGVNGCGFWTEGLTKNPQDGTFHPRPLAAAQIDGNRCQWTVVSDWRAPDGQHLLCETQAWTLTDRGDSYDLDMEWSLQAATDLVFSAYAYGGLFVRMPFIAAHGERNTVLTSNGHTTPGAAEAQRARWVAIAMPLPDRDAAGSAGSADSDAFSAVAGLAMMDHPTNVGHPQPWRVDGQLGISPSRCIAGEWRLPSGETTTARHRVFIHTGPTNPDAVEMSWARFIR
jgi:hypothetical protein